VSYPPFLRALDSRNYRLFFAGQGISLLGNWMTLTASAWLIYDLSRDPFMVGLMAFANQLPVLLLAPLGGVLGDRLPRQRLMWWLNILCAGQAAALATLTLTGEITVPRLLLLVTLRGVINAAEFPTRQSFIVELVERKADLANAIALNSSLFNVARLLGPAFAGGLIAMAGPGLCYLIDAVSFTAILTSLLAMRVRPRAAKAGQSHPWQDLWAGIRYASQHADLRPGLIMVPMISFCGFWASTLAPVFARDVFGGDSVTLGNMYSAVGAGALVSAIMLATRSSSEGLPRWIAVGAFAITLGQVGFALSPSIWLALAFLTATGFGTVLCMAGNNTLIQSQVADDKRSRVMGLFSMGQGMFPLGSLLAGSLAARYSPRLAVGLAAGGTLFAGLFFLWSSGTFRQVTTRPPTRPAPLPSDVQM